MNKEFEWTVFYTEFANALSGYAANRNGLIARLQNCYKTVAMNFPKMDYDEQVRDIDPFTVFGLFNKGISNESRIKLLTAIKGEFGIKAAVPERFHGIPILNNMMSCFFAYSNDPRRGDNDIQNLWRMYDVAMAVADGNTSRKGEFIDAWDTVVAQYAVKWNLTMGLYWIRPEFFVNLDSVNRDYINNDSSLANVINGIAPKVLTGRAMPTGVQYMGICEAVLKAISEKRIASASLPEFSYDAWKMSQDSVPVAVAGHELLCLPYSQFYKLRWDISLNKGLKGPVEAGAPVGSCVVALGDEPLMTYPLVAVEGTSQGSPWRRLTGAIKALGQKEESLKFSLAFPR